MSNSRTDSRCVARGAQFCRALAPLFSLFVAAGCSMLQPAPRQPVPDAPPEAETDFDKAANRPPTAKTLYVMAKLYAGQGKDAEAEAMFRSVLKENPKFLPAYCDMAEAQLRQRRIDEAVHTLEAGLKIDPRSPILLNDLGMCYLIRRDYERALQPFLKAAALRPDDARFRSNAATALGMLGRYEESFSLYSQMLSAADAHYNLGVICESRGDADRAAIEFRKAIELQDKGSAAAAAKSGAKVGDDDDASTSEVGNARALGSIATERANSAVEPEQSLRATTKSGTIESAQDP